jgi:3-oxoadipate enol-lactonase
LWLAATHPERVSRAVFANTAARIGSVELWTERIAEVRKGGVSAVREAAVERFLSEGFRVREPKLTKLLIDMLETARPSGYIAACEALRDGDLREIVPSIRVPSLIIAGELDESTPPMYSEELHAAIAGSELIVLPHTAHLSNFEQPKLFSAALLAFLNRP